MDFFNVETWKDSLKSLNAYQLIKYSKKNTVESKYEIC
jgi:hypothetical protein